MTEPTPPAYLATGSATAVNTPKRMFGYLVDAFLIVLVSVAAGLAFHDMEVSSLVNVAGLLLRDAATPAGSLGKRLIGLRVEFRSTALLGRVKTSVLRNLPLALPLLLLSFFTGADVADQLLFTLLFLTVLAIENWRLRVARGRRFGDLLAGCRVIDLRPREPRRRYWWLILAALVVAGVVQAVEIHFLSPDDSIAPATSRE